MSLPVRNSFLATLLLFVAAVPAIASSESGLRHARQAEAMLGAEVWTQVIRIENENPRSLYPQQVYALVFELAGILWFYTDTDGTQSFSLHVGQLEKEKADFAPPLRAIDPAFRRWTPAPELAVAPVPDAALPNGCFISSVAALRRLVASGAAVIRPRLVSYYAAPGRARAGHTVLVFESSDGRVEVLDPSTPRRRQAVSAELAGDPLQLARAVAGPVVAKARTIPLELPSAPVLVSAVASRSAAEGSGQREMGRG